MTKRRGHISRRMPYRGDLVSVAGLSTYVWRGGRGAPLLILAPEFAPSRWFPYHEALAAQFQVFAPDHPGFGQSERPTWLEGIDDMVFHYADLLDSLGLDSVALLGTSLGGWIAAELAATHPQRVRRLVLIGAAGLKVDGCERYDVFLNPIEETLRHLFHDPTRAAQLLPSEIGADRLVGAYREATSLARLTWNPYFYNPKLARRLRRIAAPTLVVWGEDDTFFAPAHGAEYARLIPDATLHTIPQCGHLVPFEKSEELVRLVGPFLAAA